MWLIIGTVIWIVQGIVAGSALLSGSFGEGFAQVDAPELAAEPDESGTEPDGDDEFTEVADDTEVDSEAHAANAAKRARAAAIDAEVARVAALTAPLGPVTLRVLAIILSVAGGLVPMLWFGTLNWKVFVISEAVSLVITVTGLLLVLSIRMANYQPAEPDDVEEQEPS